MLLVRAPRALQQRMCKNVVDHLRGECDFGIGSVERSSVRRDKPFDDGRLRIERHGCQRGVDQRAESDSGRAAFVPRHLD